MKGVLHRKALRVTGFQLVNVHLHDRINVRTQCVSRFRNHPETISQFLFHVFKVHFMSLVLLL